MDMNIINTQTEDDFSLLKSNAEDFLLSDYNSNISDDKTIAVVVNTDIIPELQPAEYYCEPDWDTLKSENNKKLYGDLPITE